MKLTKNTKMYWHVCPQLFLLTPESREPNEVKRPTTMHTGCGIILDGGGKCYNKGLCLIAERIG